LLDDALPARSEDLSGRFAALLGEAAALELSIGRSAEAASYLRRMRDATPSDALYLQSRQRLLCSWERILAGDTTAARQQAVMARDFAGEAGVPFAIAASELALAQVDLASGKGDSAKNNAAIARIETARRIASDGASPALRFASCVTEAAALLDAAPHAANEAISEAMSIGAQYSIRNIELWRPDLMARVCRAALELGLEVDYAAELIRARNLVASDAPYEVASWPWPIAIRTLGEFSVERDGAPLTGSRKTQQRPLMLLKALIARGHRGASAAALADDLWPDADGDMALQSLTVTLHRLRKLLGNEEAVTLSGGVLHINERLVWVDAFAVEELVNRGGALQREHPERAQPLYQSALRLDRGAFLPHDTDLIWTRLARERLAAVLEDCQSGFRARRVPTSRRLSRVR
jgi:hypothetical protein